MKKRGTVFVSYRRETGAEMARLVRDSLRERGFGVFMDVEDLKSGPFDQSILRQIESSTDVVVILTPGSMDRCFQEGDWLRWEVSHAIACEKNIVPVATKGFAWPSQPLPEELKQLPYFQGIEPSHDLFEASMDKLAALLKSVPKGRRSPWQWAAICLVAILLGTAGTLIWSGKPANSSNASTNSIPFREVPLNELRHGLVLYLNFDQDQQGDTVMDQSGSGNHGHLSGAKVNGNGKQRNGCKFTSPESYIEITNNHSLNPPQLTLAAWVRTSRKDQLWRRIFDKAWDHGFALSIGGDWKGRSWQGQACLEINTHFCCSGIQVTDGEWHQVAATYDGIEQRLFVDGRSAGKPFLWKGEPERNEQDLVIGFKPSATSHEDTVSYAGMLDDVMMFNRALSAREIEALYEATR